MTPFGTALRQARKERGLLLGSMAEKLKISAPYLSQIETGVKAIPDNLPGKVAKLFAMGRAEAVALKQAAEVSASEFKIHLRANASAEDRSLAAQLAGGFARMPTDKKERLRAILREDGDE